MPKNVPYAHYRIDNPECTFPETTRRAYRMTDARSGKSVWIPRSCAIIDPPNDMGRTRMKRLIGEGKIEMRDLGKRYKEYRWNL